MSKIGRNDPCHCGSGKKFKKCCMNTKSQEDLAWEAWVAADMALGQQLLKKQRERYAKTRKGSASSTASD